jgi:CRP/FNR family transcriptional regulator
MDETTQLLSTVPYFSDLGSAALEQVSAISIQQKLDAGQILFVEGDPCIGLYVVESGWLRAVKVSTAGREQVIRFVGPGDVFNEVGVLSGGVNLVTVEALEPVRLRIIERQGLLDLVDRYPSLAKSLIENLASRILYAMNMIVDLSLHSVECRLARYLLEESDRGCINRRSWATQAAIASRIGTVSVVINRAFRAFVEDELIELDKDTIRILNRAELQKIASCEE